MTDKLQEKLNLPKIKLDVGSGDHNLKQPKDEWIHLDGCDGENVDIICDFASIPLESESVDELWNGDVVEHIEQWRWNEVLTEWNRVMKIGGTIGGQTPNLHSIMVRYAKGEMSLEDATNGLYGWRSNEFQQHYITFTPETLTQLLHKYGFDNADFSESPAIIGGDPKTAWWLVFSATKTRNVKINL